MTVVSDSSPLITLARIGCFDLLPRLYPRVHISSEVYQEVVIDGTGLPGAIHVSGADWIEVRRVREGADLSKAIRLTGLGAGELSAVFLARELSADLVLLD